MTKMNRYLIEVKTKGFSSTERVGSCRRLIDWALATGRADSAAIEAVLDEKQRSTPTGDTFDRLVGLLPTERNGRREGIRICNSY